MAQRRSTPLVLRPKGVSDTLEASDVFSGAMASLGNLIPMPSDNNLWYCRPASISKYAFGDFTTPGFISCMKIIGSKAYGMISTGRFAGNDEPFCYDLSAAARIVVTGVTAANTPISPASTGAWTPPTMDVVGSLLIVTHPGYNGTGGNWFGWFNIANPAAPTWNAGNMGGAIAFTVAPSFVKNFNGRAYFIHNVVSQPAVVYSDILAATTATNANQIITFDDNVALTALGALQLDNQLGGAIQALIVFKGATNMYQITGDAAASTLSKNSLNLATGTLAPLSVASTPQGLAFVSPDGIRLVGFDARVSDTLGFAGSGVTQPFISAGVISRVSAVCQGNVLRVSVTQNTNKSGSPNEEYWYHFDRKTFSGPHTFPFSLGQPYSNTFITSPLGVLASIWQSDPVQSNTSTYVENSTQLNFSFNTPLLPDLDQMSHYSMTEATVDAAFASGVPNFSVKALDENGTVLDTVTIGPTAAATIWGAFTWGVGLWQGAKNALAPRSLNWHAPITFDRLQITITGQCASGVQFGKLDMRYQVLNFLRGMVGT